MVDERSGLEGVRYFKPDWGVEGEWEFWGDYSG